MSKSKRIDVIYNLGSIVASIALLVTAFNVNSACIWVMNQDEIPSSAKRLRKF